MVALGTAIVLTFFAGSGLIIYRLLERKMMVLVAREEQRIKAEVDRVALDGANTKIIAKAAVYAAQRVEEKLIEQKQNPVILVVTGTARGTIDDADPTLLEDACEEPSSSKKH